MCGCSPEALLYYPPNTETIPTTLLPTYPPTKGDKMALLHPIGTILQRRDGARWTYEGFRDNDNKVHVLSDRLGCMYYTDTAYVMAEFAMPIEVGDILKHKSSGTLFLVLEHFKATNTYGILAMNDTVWLRAGTRPRYTRSFLRDTCHTIG